MNFLRYQLETAEFALKRPYSGIFAEMSMGKTAIALFVLEQLKIFGGFHPTLVVAPPLILETTWVEENRKWGFDFNLCILNDRRPEKRLLKLQANHEIFLISYDMLGWLFKQRESGKLRILVCDEISKVKSTNSDRHRILAKHLFQFTRRIGLTGMPVPNHLIDLYGIMHVIDSGMTFPSKTEYESRFFYNISRDSNYKVLLPKPKAESKIHELVAKNSTVLKAEDHLDLPPYAYQNIKYELPTKVRRMYDKLERSFLLELEGDKVVLADAIATRSQKLRQVLSGFVYDGGDTHALHDARLQGVKDYVQLLQGKPTIVVYYYKESIKRLLKAFPKAGHIGSDTKMSEAIQAMGTWNKGDMPVLLMHSSKGHGTNLQFGGYHIYWYELTYVFDDYSQLNARLRRPGQKSKQVFVHHGIFANTIDELMLSNLSDKFDQQDRLFEAVKQYRRRTTHDSHRGA